MIDIKLDKDHISYTSTAKVKEICKPLLESFDISFVRYVKAYQDRTRLNLATDSDWLDKYFDMKHYLYEFVNFDSWPKENFSGHAIWSGCDQGHKMCRIWNYFKDTKDYTHNLLIYQKRDNVVELFDFFTKQTNYHLIATYLTNIDVFKHFTYLFKEKAKDLIEAAEAEKFKVPRSPEKFEKPEWIIGLLPGERKQALENMYVKRYYLTGRYEGVFISEKELDCLRELVKGKTQEEIGDALNISRRTVEYRLNNLKSKLHCRNQSELVQRTREEEVADIIKMNQDERLMIDPSEFS